MVDGLNGTVSFVNGSPILTGSFSGLDTRSIIEASLQLKRIPADRLESRIEQNDLKIEAFKEFNGLMEALRLATDGLRNPPGISGSLNNTFEQKAAFLTSDSATPGTDIMGITASTSAQTGTYTVEVDQLAKAHKVSGGTVADPAAAMGVAENLTVGVAGGATAAIAVTTDMSMNDIATAINAQQATTGVRASVIQIAAGDHRMVLTAADTNKAFAISGDAAGATLTALGLSTDNGATYTTTLQPPQPARIVVDGIATPIERDTNEFSDVIAGVTFDLYKAEPGTTVTVEIEANLGAVRDQISSFVDAYNEVRAFVVAQQATGPDGQPAEGSLLYGDSTMRTVGQRMGTELASLVGNLPANAMSTLRDVGISLDENNFLTVDQAKLDGALVDKLDEVRGLFEFSFSSDSTKLAMIARSSTVDIGDFTLEIAGTDASGNITGVNVPGYGAVFDIAGTTLTGKVGTAFEGLTLAYVGDPSEGATTINVSSSTGIAERLYQTVDAYAKPNSGVIAEEIARLTEANTRHTTQINRIDESLVLYQESLIRKYQVMEQAIAQAQAIGDQLSAALGGDDN